MLIEKENRLNDEEEEEIDDEISNPREISSPSSERNGIDLFLDFIEC